MQTKIIKILFFFGIAFNGVSLHAITVVPLGNFAGGSIEVLLTGTDAEGNTCLYEFDLVLPPCVVEQITTRPAQAIASDQIDEEPVLVLSPNPTQDTVTIQYNGFEKDMAYFVYDLTGRLMTQGELSIKQNNQALQTSSYPSGIYIVVIKEGNLLVSQHKLIKK
jgi:DNA-binding beta-propeller fold protein YncE